MLKQILIPVAAFAVTATSAAAFGNIDLSELDIDLSSSEEAALEEARDIRETAREEAQNVLEAAGIDDERMREIHDAMHSARDAHREAVNEALESGDYEDFIAAIADGPLADAITSEADFEKYLEAHELRQAGDFEAAQELFDELGLEGRGEGLGGPGGRGGHKGFGGPGLRTDLE